MPSLKYFPDDIDIRKLAEPFCYNPPQSPFTKGGGHRVLPFSKGESEGICLTF